MIEFRAGRKLYSIPRMNFRIFGPAAAAVALPTWWTDGGLLTANCLRAYTPKGAASLAASYVDATLNGDATVGTAAPDWDATNGWKFAAASTQNLITSVVPTATTSVVIRFSDAAAATGAIFGCQESGSKRFWLGPYAAAGVHLLRWGDMSTNAAPYITGGVVIVTPNGLWVDGVRKRTFTQTWGTTTLSMYIGAEHESTGTFAYITAYVQAVAFYNIDLNTSTYIADLTAAAAAL